MDKLTDIENKVMREERLSFEDGLRLFKSNDLLTIGRLANIVRERKNGDMAYFISNRHLNYSNICVNNCRFCAFRKSKGEEGAYSMRIKDIEQFAESIDSTDFSELHVVGSLEPDFTFQYYIDLLSTLSHLFPGVHIQAFTAVEIAHIAKMGNMPVKDALEKLIDAGLGSLPGGGAEIFNEATRAKICPDKISGNEWLDIMKTAHSLGLKSNATMLYGHIETLKDRVDHLIRLRETQDESGGFLAFIPLAFHPANTEYSSMSRTSGIDDLKMIAISRLMLDNFPHIKAFWIMIGPKLSQISLSFGGDDIDGTVIEEKITHAAGADTERGLTRERLIGMIREAGRVPVERGTLYDHIKVWV
ncbi:MAG: aminofutalosine synthase MqnE [Nitrospinota bacterium]|nr:aminofutalosine synthase MqnE [Nitrospinota bacterium]